MSHAFTNRLRGCGAGCAAALLLITAACGGGSERNEREERKGSMKSMLGGGGDGGNNSERGNASGERTDRGERGGERGGEREGERKGREAERSGRDNFDRRVRVVNNSDQTITLLKGSPVNQNDWGQDRIPTMTLSAGQATIVDFNDDNGECRYDLQVTFQDGSTREERNVDICRVAEWTLTSNGSSTR